MATIFKFHNNESNGVKMKGLYRYQLLANMEKSKKDRDFELKKLEFEKALELRNFEIENFWKRGWFFGALLLALGAAFFQLLDYKNSDNTKYCIYVAFLGFIVSTTQSLMNRGSKYWQERWENKTKNREAELGIDLTITRRYPVEKYLIDASTRAKNENALTTAARFSVSKLAFLVWDIITLFWLCVWITQWNLDFNATINWQAILIHIGVLTYIFLFLFMNKRSPIEKDSVIKRKWYHFFRYGGGGKVFGRFTNLDNSDDYREGTDSRFMDHSEYYVTAAKDEIEKLSK